MCAVAGELSLGELHSAFKMLGFKVKEEALKKVLDEIDGDGNGNIDYNEFEKVMSDALLPSSNEQGKAR